MYANKAIAEPTCEGWWWRQMEGEQVAVRVREGGWVMVWADPATNTWRQCGVAGVIWTGPIHVPKTKEESEALAALPDQGEPAVEKGTIRIAIRVREVPGEEPQAWVEGGCKRTSLKLEGTVSDEELGRNIGQFLVCHHKVLFTFTPTEWAEFGAMIRAELETK